MTRWIQLSVLGACMAAGAWAQVSKTVDVRQGTVVYASGNDLVVKQADGRVRHIVVPADFKFHVSGKELATNQLQPGTVLTETITTTTRDNTVTKVQNVDATVWQVNPPHLIVTMPDGKNRQVTVPEGTKFNIGGEERTVFDLRPGMRLTGTIVTETPETTISRMTKVSGHAPPAPSTPAVIGVLLIEEEPDVPQQ